MAPMTLGAVLRQARVARKVTCEQLSRATRISLRIIAAMEQDEWSKVPGGIFTRGYLRAYAREVGLDGDALAARFVAEHAPPPAPPEDSRQAPARGPERTVVRWRWPALPRTPSRWSRWPALLPLLALLFLVYFSARWSSIRDDQRTSAPPRPGAAVPTDAIGRQAAQPIGTSAHAGDGNAAAPGPADTSLSPSAPLVADVSVTRPCWVTAWADGSRTIYRIVRPGEQIQTRGGVLRFRVGDAGAVRLSLDGQPARPLGTSGQVLNVRVTRDNYQSLLPPRN